MKAPYFLIVMITICCRCVLSQSVTGTVISKSSRTPIPYAHVYYSKSKLSAYVGTFTDLNGAFEINRFPQADSLIISCIGYSAVKLNVKQILNDTIFLEEFHTQLQAITVKAKSAREYLEECIDRIPVNYRNAAFQNEGFGWQVLKVNGLPKKLIQTYFNIKQEYLALSIHTQFANDSVSKLEMDTTEKIIPAYDKLSSSLYFDLIRNGPSILNSENLDAWDFNYISDSMTQHEIVIIQAKSKGNFNDYKFFINEHDWAFLKIEYMYNWRNKVPLLSITNNGNRNNDSIRYYINQVSGIIRYEKTIQKYNIKYLFTEIKYTRTTYDWSLPIKRDDCLLINELVVNSSKEFNLHNPINFNQKRKRTRYQPSIVERKEFNYALTHLD